MTAEKPSPVESVAVVETRQSRPNTSIGELFGELSNQISALIRGEIELTKVKAASLAKKVGVGAGLLIGAAIFALYLLGWIFHTIEVALRGAMPAWGAALTVTGIILIIVLILAAIGAASMKKGMKDKPEPQVNMKLNVEAMKKGLGK